VISRNKATYKQYIESYRHPDTNQFRNACRTFFAKDANIHAIHPFNDLNGPNEYIEQILNPMLAAFENLYRTDYIVFEGSFDGGDWVTSTGYYTGHFAKPWLGLKPTHKITHLRFGEFHKLVDDHVVESYIFYDIPELMIACSQWPITDSPGEQRGYTGYLPGPTKQDGLVWQNTDSKRSESSVAFVTDMLGKLATKDEAWRPYWHPNMMWYGPAAFGSFIGIENFAAFQVPFEKTFEGWAGGSVGNGRTQHFARFADGDYICSGGWPSVSGVQVGDFLEQAPTQKMVYMRVCDWWRREGDLLTENWVFVDIPHLLLQMDYDVFNPAS